MDNSLNITSDKKGGDVNSPSTTEGGGVSPLTEKEEGGDVSSPSAISISIDVKKGDDDKLSIANEHKSDGGEEVISIIDVTDEFNMDVDPCKLDLPPSGSDNYISEKDRNNTSFTIGTNSKKDVIKGKRKIRKKIIKPPIQTKDNDVPVLEKT